MTTTLFPQKRNPVTLISSRISAQARSCRALTVTFQCLPAAVVLALSGCAASIGTVTVAPGEPGERLEVAAIVKTNSSRIRSVVLQSRPAGGTFTEVGPMTESGGKFRQNIDSTRQGSFEAKVLVNYTPLFQSGIQTVSATKAFDLSFPAGTFDFATGGLNGWTFQGVLGVTNTFAACPPAAMTSAPNFSFFNEGWPGPLSFNGSVRVLVSPNCYPTNPADLRPESGGFWQINLKSPPLDGNPAWQGARGVSFRMISGIPVRAMATVVVQGADGRDEFVSPTTAGNILDFTEIGGTWTIVTKTGYVPDRPIRHILIRIFGRPADLAALAAGNLQLDVVSPVR